MSINTLLNFIMKRTGYLCILLLGVLFSSCEQKTEWRSLLDKDLSQWRIYQSFAFESAEYNGQIPLGQDGNPLPIIGYDKNERNVFSIIEENGEPVLHITGEIYGCVFTKEDFRNYHFVTKIKWGNKKWHPRLNEALDSGILYHSQGEAGVDYFHSWMLSQEFQIIEDGCGDYWPIANSQIDIRASVPDGKPNPFFDPSALFTSFGMHTENPGTCSIAESFESPKGEWTTLELICYEGKSLHIVNGKVVMALANSRYWTEEGSKPLVSGKIQLQSEAGEVFFKDIRIKDIDSLPEEYGHYF